MFWSQGYENAPELVTKCLKSWQYFNPGYTIHFLDNNTINDFLDLTPTINIQRKDLTIQVISELYRLELLHKYGGIWTDATVFCTRPLESWLPDYYANGFFAFRNPGPDRLISTWFYASEKDNPILEKFYREYFAFFQSTRFWNKNKRIGNSLTYRLNPFFDKSVKQSLFWHSLFAKKILRVYPYYMQHYTFNKVILNNPECAEMWYSSRPFEADIPHVLQQLNREEKDLKKAIRDIDNNTSPVYKFDRRRNYSEPYWNGVLDHLSRFFR
nr:hypothetical protein [Bacteroidota bacterium]